MASNPVAGQLIRASDIVHTEFIYKAVTQGVTSSTVLVNDNDFLVTLPVGQSRVEFIGNSTGISTGAGDLKIAWTFSGTLGTSFGRYGTGPAPGSVDPTNTSVSSTARSLATTIIYGTIDTPTVGFKEDLYLDVTVAGVLQLQFAQGTSAATASNMSAGSRMFITTLVPNT